MMPIRLFCLVTRLSLAAIVLCGLLPGQVQLTSGVTQPVAINTFATCTALPPNTCIVWDTTYYIDVPAEATRLDLNVEQSTGTQLRVYGRLGSSPTVVSNTIVAEFGSVPGNPFSLTRAGGLTTGRYFLRTAVSIFSSTTVNVSGSFTLTLQGTAAYSIGGTVRDQSSSPVSGVQLSLTGGSANSATTGTPGTYSFASLAAGSNYTVTPSKAGCTFIPVNRPFVNLAGNQVAQDFVATCPTVAPTSYSFVPVAPCRVADTRDGQGKTGAFGPPALGAGAIRDIPVPQSTCNVPASAKAYSLNFTVVPKVALSFLTTWPTGQAQPLVSTLNSFHGGIVANAAIVPAGANGAISVFVTDAADVIVDINGYFDSPSVPNALDFYPITPCRTADTRGGFGGLFGPPSLAAGTSRVFPLLTGGCPLPPAARAYSLNATVVPPQPLSYLTLYPSGAAQPLVSTLNSFEGFIVANAAIVPAGNGGAISAFVTHLTDLVLDLNGYFDVPSTAGLKFYPLAPCRLADTRSAQGPVMAAGSSRSFAVAGVCSVPAPAQAYSLNVTVVPTEPLAFLTLWPTGLTRPTVSTLNSFQGRILANAAIVPAGTGGTASVFVTNTTHVILDINGYFAP